MSTSLEERDGWLYAKETAVHALEPLTIIHWWPTGVQWYQFKKWWFADEKQARAALGKPLHPTSNTSYQDERGWVYHLPQGGSTLPTFTETTPIPEPVQHGKKLPLRWKHGRWEKETAKGWRMA